MMHDIGTIIGKDLLETFSSRGSLKSGIIYLVILVAILGVLMPLNAGLDWLNEPLVALMWLWFPVFLQISVVTDSFAGERERNTLETLLASRLSDQAILLGKICAAVLYGWGISIVANLVAAVTINLTSPQAGFQFYRADIYLVLLLAPLLMGWLMASVGVLLSLNAPTARAAYQRLSLVMVAVFILPMLVINFGGEAMQAKVGQLFLGLDLSSIAIGMGVALVVLNIAVTFLAMRRFQRARLILE